MIVWLIDWLIDYIPFLVFLLLRFSKVKDSRLAPIAGQIASFFLVLGIFCGLMFSRVLPFLITRPAPPALPNPHNDRGSLFLLWYHDGERALVSRAGSCAIDRRPAHLNGQGSGRSFVERNRSSLVPKRSSSFIYRALELLRRNGCGASFFLVNFIGYSSLVMSAQNRLLRSTLPFLLRETFAFLLHVTLHVEPKKFLGFPSLGWLSRMWFFFAPFVKFGGEIRSLVWSGLWSGFFWFSLLRTVNIQIMFPFSIVLLTLITKFAFFCSFFIGTFNMLVIFGKKKLIEKSYFVLGGGGGVLFKPLNTESWKMKRILNS